MSEPSACRRQVEGESNGEPGWNRTTNQQIKSLLLCQLSYGSTWEWHAQGRPARLTTNLNYSKTAPKRQPCRY